MRLTDSFCKRFHRSQWLIRTQHNKKNPGKTYQPAFWCVPCKKLRYLFYTWCAMCNAYMVPEHKEHRALINGRYPEKTENN